MDPQPLRLIGAAAYASTAFQIAYLQPTEAENYRDLGFLYHHTREYLKAIESFSEYLRQAGDAPDASTIEHNIRVLANRLIPLN